MTVTSPPAAEMDLEDFRRLGVRPYECRLTVIRAAALRSAKSLAERQLSLPSDQVGLQLSRVATSTYRLLDPRKRHDATQRAFVGRILPNTLSLAGRTNFYNELTVGVTEDKFDRDSFSDEELVGMLDLDDPPEATATQNTCAVRLRDDDLLNAGRRAPWGVATTVIRRHPWIPLSLAGLVVGAIMGFATLNTNDGTKVAELVPGSDGKIPAHAEPPSTLVAPATSSDSVPSDALKSATKTKASPAEPEPSPTASIPDPELAMDASRQPDPDPLDKDQQVQRPQNPKQDDTVRSAETPPSMEFSADVDSGKTTIVDSVVTPDRLSDDDSGTAPSSSAMSEENGEPMKVADLSGTISSPRTVASPRTIPSPETIPSTQTPSSPGAFLPDPFTRESKPTPPPMSEIVAQSEVPAEALQISPPLVAEPLATDQTIPNGSSSPASARHRVPDESSIQLARAQLTLLVPELAEQIPVKEVLSTISKIESLERELKVGTADHWVAQMVVAEVSWLLEDEEAVTLRLQSLMRSYDTPRLRPLTESLISACGLSTQSEVQEHLLDNGLRLADKLLINESLEDCNQLIEALATSAEIVHIDQAQQHLDQLSQSLTQMERLRDSSKRVMQASEVDGDSGDLGILGRYYCLMLRRWDVGLPWLCEVSDSRVASVARNERELQPMSAVDDRIKISSRWFSVASRSSGRAADSMRLHGLEILKQTVPDLKGLKRLEAERRIDEISGMLPSFVLESAATTAPAESTPSSGVPVTQGGEITGALRGRISVDGEDLGVQLEYQLGVAFTQSVFDTIARRLDLSMPRMSTRFAGEILLEEPVTAVIELAPMATVTGAKTGNLRAETGDTGTEISDALQRLEIDGQPVEIEENRNAVQVSLQPGTHVLVWSLEATQISRSYLRIRRLGSGEPIAAVEPSEAGEEAYRTNLTVEIVRNSP